MSLPITPIDTTGMPTHPPPPLPLLLNHEIVLDITSPKGYGKTTLLIRYLEHYANYFHRIYIFSPTVSNDPNWNYLFSLPKIAAKNKSLETWLGKNHPELFKLRELPIDKVKTRGLSSESGDTSHPSSLKGLPFRKSSKNPGLPTKASIVTRGAHRVLETPEGLFMNANPDSLVVGFPRPMEERRVAILPTMGTLNQISKLKNSYYTKPHNTLNSRKIDSSENIRVKFKEEKKAESEEDDEQDMKSLFPKGKLSQNIVCSNNDPEVFEAICNTQQSIINALEKQYGEKAKFKADRILFILDDVVGTPLFKDNGYFMSWITRHRHFSASVILVTQAYKKVPKTIRTNINGLVLFRMHSQKELESIYEEYPLNLSYKEWLSLYQALTMQPYSFMFINVSAELGKQVYQNFEYCHPTPTQGNILGDDMIIKKEPKE